VKCSYTVHARAQGVGRLPFRHGSMVTYTRRRGKAWFHLLVVHCVVILRHCKACSRTSLLKAFVVNLEILRQ